MSDSGKIFYDLDRYMISAEMEMEWCCQEWCKKFAVDQRSPMISDRFISIAWHLLMVAVAIVIPFAFEEPRITYFSF